MELACLAHGTRAVCLAAGLNLSGLAADLGFPANTYAIRPLQTSNPCCVSHRPRHCSSLVSDPRTLTAWDGLGLPVPKRNIRPMPRSLASRSQESFASPLAPCWIPTSTSTSIFVRAAVLSNRSPPLPGPARPCQSCCYTTHYPRCCPAAPYLLPCLAFCHALAIAMRQVIIPPFHPLPLSSSFRPGSFFSIMAFPPLRY